MRRRQRSVPSRSAQISRAFHHLKDQLELVYRRELTPSELAGIARTVIGLQRLFEERREQIELELVVPGGLVLPGVLGVVRSDATPDAARGPDRPAGD